MVSQSDTAEGLAASRRGLIRACFAAAHFAKSLAWSFVDLLLAYFLISVLGASADLASRLLFLFLAVGAIFDLVVGAAITWFGASLRRVLVFHLIGAGAASITLIWQFTLISAEPLVILTAGMAFRLAFAIYDVPQNALTSLLPTDDADARRYVALRTTLAAVARLVVTAANLGLAQLPETVFRLGGSLLLSVIGLGMATTAVALLVTARRAGMERVPAGPRRMRLPRGGLQMLAAFFVSTTLFATLSRLVIFAAPTPTTPHLGPWLLLAVSVGGVLGPWLALRLEDRIGWRIACLSASGMAVAFGGIVALQPATGLDWMLPACALGYGVGLGGTGAFLWESATRVVMGHAVLTGQRADGVVFGLVVFVIQGSIALSSLLLGLLVDGFAAGSASSSFLLTAVTLVGGVLTAGLLVSQRRGSEAV